MANNDGQQCSAAMFDNGFCGNDSKYCTGQEWLMMVTVHDGAAQDGWVAGCNKGIHE